MTLLNTNTVTLTAPADDSAEPPVMWWFNGVKAAKTPGVFYIKESALPDRPGEPWKVDDRFDNEVGFSAASLRIAYIGHRSQAYLEEDTAAGYKRKVWLSHYEKGARIQTEILCLVEGIEGPVVWSCKGMTAKAMTAKAGSIISTYRAGLLREASRLEGSKLPPWSFWLPISGKATAEGKPAYEDTGFGSFVTPPALAIPDLSEATITRLFVGLDLLKRGDELRTEYDGWLKQQRGNAPEPAPAGATFTPAAGWAADEGEIEF